MGLASGLPSGLLQMTAPRCGPSPATHRRAGAVLGLAPSPLVQQPGGAGRVPPPHRPLVGPWH